MGSEQVGTDAQFVDENQQKLVDELNFGMEMELDKNDLNEANHAKAKEESKDMESHHNGKDHSHKQAGNYCQECNTHHSVIDTLSGQC